MIGRLLQLIQFGLSAPLTLLWPAQDENDPEVFDWWVILVAYSVIGFCVFMLAI